MSAIARQSSLRRRSHPEPAAATTAAEALALAVRTWPDADALIMSGRRHSFADLHQRSLTVGAALDAAGLVQGDHLGLLLDNSPEYLELVLGCFVSGVVPVLFNTRMTSAQLAARLPSLKLKGLFVGASPRGDLSRSAGDALRALSKRGDDAQLKLWDLDLQGEGRGDYDAFLAAGEAAPAWTPPPLVEDDPVLVVFTAGTTGEPKTCRIGNRHLMSKLKPLASRFELGAESTLWLPVPMFQIGFVTPFLTALSVGAATVATEEDDPAAALEMLETEGVTHAYPIYLNRWLPLVYHIDFLPSRVPELAYACVTGPAAVLRRTQRAVPQCTLMNTYGSPEEGGAFCFPEASDPAEIRLGSSGKPFPGHDVRIVDPVSGRPRPPGAMGEIQVRGEGVPSPASDTSYTSAYTDDGWLRSGDLGSIGSEGQLIYAGRLSEMLTIDGESVSSLAIEAVLGSHPAVALAQVIGKPDKALGEVAVAFVELRPGGDATDEGLVEYCRSRLPEAQAPRYVTFVSDWPTSASKILKPALAERPLGRRLLG